MKAAASDEVNFQMSKYILHKDIIIKFILNLFIMIKLNKIIDIVFIIFK